VPSTNLDFSVSADTSKARADLKLLNEQMKLVGQQMRAALKAGDAAGARGFADTFGVMAANAAGLTKELRATTGAMDNLGRSTALTQRSFKSFEGAILGIGRSLGGAKAGLIAFAAVTGVEKLLSNLDEVDKRLRDIRDTSQEIAGAAGETPESANKILASFSAAFAKAQVEGQSAADAIGNVNSQIQQGVQVFKGASPIVLDLAHAYETLGIHLNRYKGDAAAQEKAFLDAAKVFLQAQRNFNPAQLNELSKALFGVSAAAAKNALPEMIANVTQKVAELQNAERGATDDRLKQIAALDAARSKLTDAFNELNASVGNASRQTRIDFADWLTSVLKGRADFEEALKQGMAQWKFHLGDFDDWQKRTKEAFGTLWGDIGTDLTNSAKLWEAALPDFSGWIERTKAAFKSLWDSIKAGTAAAGAAAAGSGTAPASALIPETVNVFSATMDGGGGSGVLVGRGPGTGPTGGYGPASFNQEGGHGPGSFPTQSILPGVSDYQAPPPKMVSPSMMSTHPAVKSAAEASADAAYAARTAAEASATAVNAWVKPGYSAYASGGMVRGPGTATSDSIVARLSAGEFVMRAAAVNRLGAGFLSRLNGFADGGMAMPSRGMPRFAGGGMVHGGGGGSVVNLHFPGGSFSLRADAEIVGGLTREARRAGMLSAGRMAGALA
jgi:hypothetical protein